MLMFSPMRIGYHHFLCGLAVAWMAAGCASPTCRAHRHREAFQKLAPADQRMVLAGHVHRGMSKEAVYIAWGEPDEKTTASAGKDAPESWLYYRQIVVQGVFGSFDQWSPGNNLFGTTVPLAINAGAGFGGIGNEGMLLYQPRLRIVDATVKTGLFVGDKLERYDIRQGSYRLAP